MKKVCKIPFRDLTTFSSPRYQTSSSLVLLSCPDEPEPGVPLCIRGLHRGGADLSEGVNSLLCLCCAGGERAAENRGNGTSSHKEFLIQFVHFGESLLLKVVMGIRCSCSNDKHFESRLWKSIFICPHGFMKNIIDNYVALFG